MALQSLIGHYFECLQWELSQLWAPPGPPPARQATGTRRAKEEKRAHTGLATAAGIPWAVDSASSCKQCSSQAEKAVILNGQKTSASQPGDQAYHTLFWAPRPQIIIGLIFLKGTCATKQLVNSALPLFLSPLLLFGREGANIFVFNLGGGLGTWSSGSEVPDRKPQSPKS